MITDHHQHKRNVLLAVFLTCLGYGMFNVTDACVKMLAAKFHFTQIIFISSACIFTFVSLHGWLTEGKKAFVFYKPKWIFLRGLFNVASILVNVQTIPHVKLTTFYTLIFTSPFWVALLSALFLKEKMETRRVAVILLGFGVIIYIFRPGGDLFNFWTLAVLLNALLYSCMMIIMRYLGPKASRTAVLAPASLMCVLTMLPFLPAHYIAPTLYEWVLFLLLGGTSSIAIVALSHAYQNSPSAALIAPYHYTQIFWGAVIGYFIFNEIPDMQTMVGAAILIAAGLYLIYGETRRPVVTARGV